MPNVLLVSYSYPPAGNPQALRAAKLAKYLPELGWSPTVLCAPRGYSNVGLTALGDHSGLPGVTEVRANEPFLSVKSGAVQHFGKDSSSLIRKAANYLLFPDRNVLWAASAIYRGLEHSATHRPDIIYSSSPPVTGHLVAYALAKLLKTPWIAEFRDPWTRWDPSLREGLRGRAALLLERHIYRSADALVAISNSLKADIVADLPDDIPNDKVAVIPNGYDPDDFPSTPPDPLFGSDVFALAYAGMFYGGGRDPRGLLDAIKLLRDKGIATDRNFRLVIIGTPEPQIVSEVQARSLNELVDFRGYQPYSKTISLLAAASACVLITHTHHPSLPVKLFDYLGTKLPILALTRPDFEVARIVLSERPTSHVAIPSDTLSIAGWLSAQISSASAKPAENHRSAGSENFSRLQTAKKVASLLYATSGQPNPLGSLQD